MKTINEIDDYGTPEGKYVIQEVKKDMLLDLKKLLKFSMETPADKREDIKFIWMQHAYRYLAKKLGLDKEAIFHLKSDVAQSLKNYHSGIFKQFDENNKEIIPDNTPYEQAQIDELVDKAKRQKEEQIYFSDKESKKRDIKEKKESLKEIRKLLADRKKLIQKNE